MLCVAIFGSLMIYRFDIVPDRDAAGAYWPDELLELVEFVVLPFGLLILCFFFVSRWVIRSALEPLGEATKLIDAVDSNVRGFRVDLHTFPIELQPFASAINNLLARLDRTAEFHEAFASEVAHELKTPLAILLLELERIGTPEVERLKDDVVEMNRLVDQIMLMAQADADLASPLPRSLVSLEAVATRVATRFAPIAASQGKQVEVSLCDPQMIVGNKEALVVAVGNLVENGLRVTPAGGGIVVEVGPGAMIAVRDGGPGLSPMKLAALSKRFARGDNPSSGGAGLGLAIVAKVVATHRGTLASDPSKSTIVLSFE